MAWRRMAWAQQASKQCDKLATQTMLYRPRPNDVTTYSVEIMYAQTYLPRQQEINTEKVGRRNWNGVCVMGRGCLFSLSLSSSLCLFLCPSNVGSFYGGQCAD